MNLVGIYGDSRSGKDTVASILVQHLGFEQRNMADPIREALLAINPPLPTGPDGVLISLLEIVDGVGWDFVKKECPETVDWMINLGQYMRTISPRIWLDACLAKPYERLVIPDVRQPNEYDEIIQQGGVVWNVKRTGTVPRGMDRLLEDREFDAVIYNNHSMNDLKEVVLKFARSLTNGPEADQRDQTSDQD